MIGYRPCAALAVALAVGGAACDGAIFETSHGAVNDGNAALVAGEVDAARARYAEAAAALPATAPLDYVRGLAESAAGAHEAATQLLLRALDTRDPGLLQRVRAALGLAYARWGLALERAPAVEDEGAEPSDPKAAALARWRLAVEHLEEALRLDPDDEGALRNLEVALLRVDPPCSSRDDAFERNNSRETAALIEVSAPQEAAPPGLPPGAPPPATSPEMAKDLLEWTQQLHSCPEDPDYFAIELEAGDRIAAALTIPKKPGAKLSLELSDPDGEVLSPAFDASGAPSVAFDLSERPAPVTGRYILRVDNVELDETSYGLEVKVRPRCSSVEDRFEPNDTRDEAALVNPGALADLKLCPDNEDWYAIELAEGESLFLYVTPQEEAKAQAAAKTEGEGDADDGGRGDNGADGGDGEEPGEAPAAPPAAPLLATEIHDAEGALRAVGAPTGAGRVSALLTPGPGRYFVRVVGAPGFEGRYDMNLEVVPPCPEGNDRFEPNDLPEDATDVAAVTEAMAAQAGGAQGAAPGGGGPTVLFARVCPGDIDWFAYTEQSEHPTIISAIFEHSKGDLRLELYDEAGVELLAASDTSSPLQNGEAVIAPPHPAPPDGAADADDAPPAPRTFRVKVSGANEADNFYLLEFKQPSPSPDGPPERSEDESEGDDDSESDDPEDSEDDGDDRQQPPEPESRSEPLQDALDKLDRNPENLEALESARTSPVSDHRPRKDW